MNHPNNSLRIVSGPKPEVAFTGRPAEARPGEHSPRPRIAFVLSEAGYDSAHLLPVLAGLGITTLDRTFDERSIELVCAIHPDLAIAVCSTAGPAGISMIRALAASGVERILVMDANPGEGGSVSALQLGADVALSGDAAAGLIRATLLALTRRIPTTRTGALSAFAPAQIRVGRLVVDHDACEARDNGEIVPLTPTEFRILAHLALHSGKVQSAREIMFVLHDYHYSDSEAQQTVKVYVRRIRRKLGACAQPSVEVLNSRSFGYKLQPAAEHPGAGNVAA